MIGLKKAESINISDYGRASFGVLYDYGGNMDKETKDYLAYKMAEMRRKTRELKTKKFKRKKDWKIFRAKVNKENTDEQ